MTFVNQTGNTNGQVFIKETIIVLEDMVSFFWGEIFQNVQLKFLMISLTEESDLFFF